MKTKILYIHHAISLGGAPTSLSLLIAGLDKSKFEPIVVMPKRTGNDTVKKLFTEAGAKVIEEAHVRPFNGVNGCPCDTFHGRMYAVLSAFHTTRAARAHTRRIKPDIVHLNTSVLPFAGFGARLAGQGVPVVTHVREAVLSNWWGKILAGLNRAATDWFVGIDQSGLDRIQAPPLCSSVIPNFVDQSDFQPNIQEAARLREQFNCSADDVLFVSICRIAESNGSLEMAQFLEAHEKTLPKNCRFVFCGFKERESAYVQETLAAIEGNAQAFAMDFTSNVANLIAASDVVMAPFKSAHSARVIIEGATMGKPGLVTDFDNLLEQIIVGKTGFAFSYSDPESLMTAIKQFAHSPQARKNMGEAAKQFAIDNYSIETNVTRIQDLYLELCSQR